MLRGGVLNAQLARVLAELGHTHTIVVGDCGLPRPDGVEVVDLAVVLGVPSFADVLRAVVGELALEGAVMAREVVDANPAALDLVRTLVGEPELVPHEDFKVATGSARAFVRTGEASPYANVILRCGVPF
ncbi:MAG: D-ribose pyranase [Propionibacteriaceae bacterium]|nr:D-ribose pyranase [Propionibacteriaceae bacterium]